MTEVAILITAVTALLAGIVAAIRGLVTALRWWEERTTERITGEVLGKQAIRSVETKNEELDAVRATLTETERKLRDCLDGRRE